MVTTPARGRSSSPPPSDAAADDLVALIDQMIAQRVAESSVRIGTITNVRGDDAQVSVQRWDEEAGGQQFRARVAGTDFRNGDTVVLAPTGGGEYVVLGKIANSNADKAVIGAAELRNNAIGARHIANGEITPALLDRTYATPQQVSQATNGLASQATVNQHVQNLQAALNAIQQQINQLANNPSGVTMAQVNQRLDANVFFNHKHMATRISQNNGYEVMSALTYLKAFVTCTYNNRNKAGNPCSRQKANMAKIG